MHPLTPTAAADLARDGAPCGPAADIDPARLVSDLRAGGQLRDDLRAAVGAHSEACRAAGRAGKPRPCWEGGSLSGANLSGADLRGANLTCADLSGAKLRGADLTCADLSGANLSGADLRGADLRGANFRDANLTCADLIGANLTCAYLSGAKLRGATLRDANLTCADLSGANLTCAYLSGAKLRGATLRYADLTCAYLSGADLSGADLSGAIVPEGAVVAVIVGEAGGYRWHAFALVGGECILRYGCDRATLAEWRMRGPEYGRRHGHEPEHWATGPAVAIAAAEAMMAGRGDQ